MRAMVARAWRSSCPGIVMGACEAPDPAGMRLLVALNAPFMDGRGNRLAPLALVLETAGIPGDTI